MSGESRAAGARAAGSRSPRRLLFVIHSLRGGGAGRVCAALANGLAERGHTVAVAVNYLEESIWHDAFSPGVELVRLGAGHARRSVGPLTELVKRFRPTAVLAFNYQLAIVLLAVRRRASKAGSPRFRAVSRHIVAMSESMQTKSVWHRLIAKTIVKRLYRKLDLVIAQSEGMYRDLVSRFHIRPERTRIIYNPLLPDPAAEPPQLPPALAAAGAPVLLYLGRFKPQKQPLLLLDLLERVRHDRPDTLLAAAGNGPLLDEFQAAVARRGLSDAVFYLGYVLNPAPLFRIATATVLTSAYEGFPNVLIDSLAHGVPVASFDCPTGPSEIVRSGENGFLAAPGDIEGLAAAVLRLIADPPPGGELKQSAQRFSLATALDLYEDSLCG